MFVAGNETSPMCFVVFAAYPADFTATTYAHMAIPSQNPVSRARGRYNIGIGRREEKNFHFRSESALFGRVVAGFGAVPLTILIVYVLLVLHLLGLGLVPSELERSCAPIKVLADKILPQCGFFKFQLFVALVEEAWFFYQVHCIDLSTVELIVSNYDTNSHAP